MKVLFFVFIASIAFGGEAIPIEEITGEYGEILSIIKKDGKVYLECEGGLVLIENKEDLLEDKPSLSEKKGFVDNCLTIQEVQKMAIGFSGLAPDRINKLKRLCKYKALLPQFKIDYDKTISYSVTDKHLVGPNDWSISFTWDLDKLIYNPDIATLDDKSRYTTTLRNKLIEDVTRLYFKRKALIAKGEDPIKIEELEALIDGYTGGEFSKALTKNKHLE